MRIFGTAEAVPFVQRVFSDDSRSLLGALEFHLVLLSGSLNSLPSRATFRLGDALYLVEARGRVAYVRGVLQGFFTLLGKRVLGRGYPVASCLI
jgi:hypothetical protein